jgi:hypothetical protein
LQEKESAPAPLLLPSQKCFKLRRLGVDARVTRPDLVQQLRLVAFQQLESDTNPLTPPAANFFGQEAVRTQHGNSRANPLVSIVDTIALSRMKTACLLLLFVGGLTVANQAEAQVRFGIPLPIPFLFWGGGKVDKHRQHNFNDDYHGSSYSRPHYYYDESYRRRYYTDDVH